MVQLFYEEEKKILEYSLETIQLISYFKDATRESPIFLSDIQKKYHEIQPLLELELIKCQKAESSYIFNLDKLENYFYAKYQEKIDNLRLKIREAKKRKKNLMKHVAEMEPEEGCPDYEQKLLECLIFARKAAQETEIIENERKNVVKMIEATNETMRKDSLFELLFYIRNDKEIAYNKRIIDPNNKIKKKIIHHAGNCSKDEDMLLYADLKKRGIFKAYNSVQSYYITDFGKKVDNQLKNLVWTQEDDSYEKNSAEIAQEKEFESICKKFGF